MTAESEGAFGSAQLRKLQLLELRVLQDFAQFCDENGLRYYLVFGTLLGAIRHEGFIPWDDDVDVAMPRDDYRRLPDLISASLGDRYRLLSNDVDPAYPYLFSKLSLRDTRLDSRPGAERSFERGVGLDIFPLDGAPSSRAGRAIRKDIVRTMKLRISNPKSLRKRTRSVRWMAPVFRLIPRAAITRAYDWAINRWPASGSQTLICLGPYRATEFPAEWFGDGKPHSFEGVMLNGPVRAHDYLTRVYGEYMRPPPPEARLVGHGEISFVDFGSQLVEENVGEAKAWS